MAGQGRPKDRVFEVKVDFGTVAKALGGFATFFHSQPGNAGPNLDELSESVILGLSFEEREGGGWLREDPLPTAVRAGPEARELLVKDCAHLCSASYEDLDEAARLGEARGFHLVRDLSDGDVKVFEKDGAAYIAWRGTDLDKSAERDLRAGISAFIGACFVHKRFHAARDFAKMVKERFNGRVHLTGHSLGGALAANAARWLGLFCDSFNAPSSMLSLGLAHVTSGMSAMANRTLYGHLVTLHRTPHDYVSMLNFTGGGRQRIHPEKDAANPHGMANFM
ncbi:unnamed protein product [Pedinophyceae sp. YPF-701]|nr:unnamed protein product [Pedinophyceae sp. YPF-701]